MFLVIFLFSAQARELLSREYSERLNALKRIHYEMQQLEPSSDSAIVKLRACGGLLRGTMRDVPNVSHYIFG